MPAKQKQAAGSANAGVKRKGIITRDTGQPPTPSTQQKITYPVLVPPPNLQHASFAGRLSGGDDTQSWCSARKPAHDERCADFQGMSWHVAGS